MATTRGSGDFTENVTASGSVTAPTGTYSLSLTVSGLPVITSLVESENGFFLETVTGTIALIERAPYSRDIINFTGQTTGGSVSGTLSIDGTDVDGITNEVWNTSQVTSTATGANSIPVGGRMLLTLSGESDFSRFGWSYSSERA